MEQIPACGHGMVGTQTPRGREQWGGAAPHSQPVLGWGMTDQKGQDNLSLERKLSGKELSPLPGGLWAHPGVTL